jgi:hypothetical protein
VVPVGARDELAGSGGAGVGPPSRGGCGYRPSLTNLVRTDSWIVAGSDFLRIPTTCICPMFA